MQEIWKAIADDDRYEVSNMGNVRSFAVRGPGGHRRADPRPVIGSTARGYRQIRLPGGKRKKTHRLVLETFVGPRPSGFHCRHMNGDRLDNRLSNIAWGTAKANIGVDRRRHGTDVAGERNPKAKLVEDQVRLILVDDRPHPLIAAEFGVSRGTVGDIKRRATWRHLDAL